MKDHHKMRAWCRQKQEYIHGFVVEADGSVAKVGPYGQMWPIDVELERCTGLRDKNGVLIYEGDKDEDGVINYEHGCFWVGNTPLMDYDQNDLLIIGNIHQKT